MAGETDEVEIGGGNRRHRGAVVGIVAGREQIAGIERTIDTVLDGAGQALPQLRSAGREDQDRLADERSVAAPRRVLVARAREFGIGSDEAAGQEAGDVQFLPDGKVVAHDEGDLGVEAPGGGVPGRVVSGKVIHGFCPMIEELIAESAGTAVAGLEGSCGKPAGPKSWLRLAPPAPGILRMEAFFTGHAFDAHAHDTYAFGVTLSGVQCFDYRGARRDSLGGQAIVLHPDEFHNGRAGIETGFHYRMIYLAPHLIARALDGRAAHLPFIRAAVSSDPRLVAALSDALQDFDQPLSELAQDHVVSALAEALLAADESGQLKKGARGRKRQIDIVAIERTRAYLDAAADSLPGSAELERVSGLDRFTLARQFGRRTGTSPHRYLVMRRLERARDALLAGAGIADAAIAAGFADQAHFTRQFRRAVGMTPGRWRAMTAAA